MNTGRGGIWSLKVDFEDLDVAEENVSAVRRLIMRHAPAEDVADFLAAVGV